MLRLHSITLWNRHSVRDKNHITTILFFTQIMHQLQKIDNDYLDTTYKDYLIMSGHVRRTGWYINL